MVELRPSFLDSVFILIHVPVGLQGHIHFKYEFQKYYLIRDYFAVVLRAIPLNSLENCGNATKTHYPFSAVEVTNSSTNPGINCSNRPVPTESRKQGCASTTQHGQK